jgi:hypothetical protein
LLGEGGVSREEVRGWSVITDGAYYGVVLDEEGERGAGICSYARDEARERAQKNLLGSLKKCFSSVDMMGSCDH